MWQIKYSVSPFAEDLWEVPTLKVTYDLMFATCQLDKIISSLSQDFHKIWHVANLGEEVQNSNAQVTTDFLLIVLAFSTSKNFKLACYLGGFISNSPKFSEVCPFYPYRTSALFFSEIFFSIIQNWLSSKEMQWNLPVSDIPNSGHTMISGQKI